MAKMLILTGPQGAGNHLWSKIFSLHPEVYGWKTLLENYWEAHRFAEPFARYWRDHAMLDDFNWAQSEYYFTSISCPLGIINSNMNPIWNPDIAKFSERVMSLGIDVKLAVIGRDRTILINQQTRIRTQPTVDMLLEQLPDIIDPTFLSYELLYLYKQDYLKSLRFNIPVAWNDSRINNILADDANAKYIHRVDYNPLDEGNRQGITFIDKP